MQKIKKDQLKLAPVYILITLIAFIIIIPFYWALISSFKQENEIFSLPNILIRNPTMLNYIKLFTETIFERWFFNSTLIALSYSLMVLFFCSLGGFAFAKYNFPGRDVLFLIILSTAMIPPWVTIIPIFIWFAKLHLVNTYLALIIPGSANAFGIFLMRQYIHSIPSSIIDSSRIDGCSEFQIYYKIIVPVIRPALGALAIFSFIGSWNSFLNALILMRTPNMFTFPVGMSSLVGAQNPRYGMLMACAVISVIPVGIIFLSMQKHLVAGLTLGATKG